MEQFPPLPPPSPASKPRRVLPLRDEGEQRRAIDADIPCKHCGYVLRGLTLSGRCPECGTAVAASLTSDLLGFCDREWVRAIGRGALVSGVATGLYIAARIGFVFLLALIVPGAWRGSANLVYLPAAALSAWGAWLVTRLDPAAPNARAALRGFVRFTFLVALGWALVAWPVNGMAMRPDVRAGFSLVALGLGLVVIPAEWARMMLVARYAARIPASVLARSVRAAAWAWAGSRLLALAVTMPITLLSAVGADVMAYVRSVWYGVSIAVAGLAMLTAGTAAAIALWNAGRRIGREARDQESGMLER